MRAALLLPTLALAAEPAEKAVAVKAAHLLDVRTGNTIDHAVVISFSNGMFPAPPRRARLLSLSLVQRLPVVGNLPAIARLGDPFSYGPDRTALYRRAATYVDRILKGAKPGDLPIEQSTNFELVLNLKTAATLGIVIPPSMRVRATEVIE